MGHYHSEMCCPKCGKIPCKCKKKFVAEPKLSRIIEAKPKCKTCGGSGRVRKVLGMIGNAKLTDYIGPSVPCPDCEDK